MTPALRPVKNNPLQNIIDKLTAHIGFMLSGISILMLIGIAIVIGPKLPEGPIHISLPGGHGITAQDILALVPISMAVAWLGLGLWKHQHIWVDAMRHSPIKAFLFALILGLFVGFVFGLPVGAVLKTEVKSFINLITN